MKSAAQRLSELQELIATMERHGAWQESKLRAILGWRELRSGANEIPIERIEKLALEGLAGPADPPCGLARCDDLLCSEIGCDVPPAGPLTGSATEARTLGTESAGTGDDTRETKEGQS